MTISGAVFDHTTEDEDRKLVKSMISEQQMRTGLWAIAAFMAIVATPIVVLTVWVLCLRIIGG